jgi:hypothetical protein
VTDPISVDQLIEVVYRDAFESAVTDCEAVLSHPPGRAPRDELKQLARWYARLSDDDRVHLRAAMTMSADFALFGMLCLIDNVRPLTDGFDQTLHLSVEVDGERFDFDPKDPLHDAFRSKVDSERRAA